ncbi:MAG: DUF3179 domain-containing (seleno)protein [Saprospiraceae bacterium]
MPISKFIISLILAITLAVACSPEDEFIDSNNAPVQSLYTLDTFQFKSQRFLKIESSTLPFIIAFELDGKSESYAFKASREAFPVVMEDEQGGLWNVFGECISGPYSGSKLNPATGTLAYWFSWINLFPSYTFNGIVKENASYQINDPAWNISTEFVNEGAKFDAIPSIDNPLFDMISFKEALLSYDFLREDDKVIVVSLNGETKIYPVKILDHHEIVNDIIGEVPVVISYAPYTGSPSVHRRRIDGQDRSFGVSGQVYMNNILLFDRETGSFWSQLLNRAVVGSMIGKELEVVSFIMTDWSTWMNAEDAYTVLSENQGFDLDYRTPKFDSYMARDSFLPFDVPVFDEAQANKALIYGLSIDEEVQLFTPPH